MNVEPEALRSPGEEVDDGNRAKADGRAAVGIVVLTVTLIAFVIAQLV